MKYQRVRRLMQADMNLIAYHLPLDAHPVLGNNAQLGLKLGLSAQGQSPIEPLVWFGEHSANLTIGAFCTQITDVLGRTPLLIGEPRARLGRVAWCTGGAQDYIHIAAQLGAPRTFRVKPLNEPTMKRANWVSTTLPAVTMPLSVLAYRLWENIWRNSLDWIINFLMKTILCKVCWWLCYL